MALKELLKQRVMEKLNFSQEISDEHLKGVIQEDHENIRRISVAFV